VGLSNSSNDWWCLCAVLQYDRYMEDYLRSTSSTSSSSYSQHRSSSTSADYRQEHHRTSDRWRWR